MVNECLYVYNDHSFTTYSNKMCTWQKRAEVTLNIKLTRNLLKNEVVYIFYLNFEQEIIYALAVL